MQIRQFSGWMDYTIEDGVPRHTPCFLTEARELMRGEERPGETLRDLFLRQFADYLHPAVASMLCKHPDYLTDFSGRGGSLPTPYSWTDYSRRLKTKVRRAELTHYSFRGSLYQYLKEDIPDRAAGHLADELVALEEAKVEVPQPEVPCDPLSSVRSYHWIRMGWFPDSQIVAYIPPGWTIDIDAMHLEPVLTVSNSTGAALPPFLVNGRKYDSYYCSEGEDLSVWGDDPFEEYMDLFMAEYGASLFPGIDQYLRDHPTLLYGRVEDPKSLMGIWVATPKDWISLSSALKGRLLTTTCLIHLPHDTVISELRAECRRWLPASISEDITTIVEACDVENLKERFLEENGRRNQGLTK